MNVDEMDLVARELDVTPWRPEAYEEARAVLRAAIAESGSVPEPLGTESFPGRSRGVRRLITRGKVGAGFGAVAAAAALVLAVTATSQTATSTTGAAGPAPAVQSPLVSLAAYVTASSGTLPGNASMIVSTQTIGTSVRDVTFNLYTDGGKYYVGADKKSLMRAVARHETDAAWNVVQTNEVAATRYAAKGDLATARKKLVNADPNDAWLGLSAAERQKVWDKNAARRTKIDKKKGPAHAPTDKEVQKLIGNRIWNDGTDALTAGAGDPKVRAGVLRLFSTVSDITVKKSTTGGQATLTLTAGSALFLAGPPQVLTIDAKTAMPIKSTFKAASDEPASSETYKVSRVTLNSRTGKF